MQIIPKNSITGKGPLRIKFERTCENYNVTFQKVQSWQRNDQVSCIHWPGTTMLTTLETVHMQRFMRSPEYLQVIGQMTGNSSSGFNLPTTGRGRNELRFNWEPSVDTDAMTPPITPTTPVSPKEYEIVLATADDKEDVLNFLRTFFFQDEPLNKYLGLISDGRPRCLDLEKFAIKELDNGLNLKAVHNGKTIGVCLNGLLEKGQSHSDDDSEYMTDPKFSIILRLLNRVGRESDLFARFPEHDKAMTVKILSVDGAYRGQGIAKELMNKTRDMAREQGAGFMAVDCTSHFTALALRKLGFELHYSLKYADHKENGEVVLKPEPPHEAVTVYVQKI